MSRLKMWLTFDTSFVCTTSQKHYGIEKEKYTKNATAKTKCLKNSDTEI